MVPSNLEHHVSSSQPRLGSRLFVYTPVCGALTFPLPTSTSRKILLYKLLCYRKPLRGLLRYLPPRSVAWSFFKPSVFDWQHSIYVNQWPQFFWWVPHSGGRSTCTCVLFRGTFYTAVFSNWPANLMCCYIAFRFWSASLRIFELPTLTLIIPL